MERIESWLMIMAFFWGLGVGIVIGLNHPARRCYKSADLNHDGQVNLADFSIMMSQWTEEK